ncbi:MAG: aminodeoxychorismate synthase component I [Desulfobacula sp.]|nr:aminodeoxychorismate synthase component I [Desulfobacula sp.]
MNNPKMDEWLKQLPTIKAVHQEILALDRPFEDIAAFFAHDIGTVLLLSGGDLDCSQYHILAVNPWLEIQSRKEKVSVRCLDKTLDLEIDPFFAVQAILNQFRLASGPDDIPVSSGLFGYFSYDLKDRIEDLPRTVMETGLPDLVLYGPSLILIREKATGKTRLCIPILSHSEGPKENQGKEKDRVREIRESFFKIIETQAPNRAFSMDGSGFKSSFTKAEYISAVQSIIGYLRAGDIYQANLSQRFETGFSGDGYALFLDLFHRNPAPFFAYIHAKDHTIVSTSPERFLWQTGRKVETRPIKGTIARGKTEKEDRENGVRLCESIKDDAELTMIVDLMRNDLSRVTRHGSVTVKEHKRLEPYANVFHLVSIVEGELETDKTSMDLIRATFPGGSITGCPKIRSMEIIDELEPLRRHVYTGSIGYVSFHDTMDLSIAIRTAVISGNRIHFSVGGGIVYDSNPEKEFQETLDKGKTLMESLTAAAQRPRMQKAKAWVNGKQVDAEKASISPLSLGFHYGAGLFETLRADKGVVFRVKHHLSRLNQSWETLFSEPAPDITWEDIIGPLIRENRLTDRQAVIKLILAKAGPENEGEPFLAAFAREYCHRLDVLGKTGLDLVTYPFPRQSPLADHKTLNYFYYYQAGQYARSRQADEALILNPDGTVSETNTAAVFVVEKNTVIVPESLHVLPSVTLNSVLTLLSDKGYDIKRKKMEPEALYSSPNVFLANALMGAVKALSVDGKKIDQEKGICSMINDYLFKTPS